MSTTPRFLAFSVSDDGEDRGSWEAMASVRSESRAAALAEIQALLSAAQSTAPGPRGPEEDGGLWDAELLEQQEGEGWCTLTLTLTGPWAWGEALRERFESVDAD